MHVKIVNTKNNAESWEKVYVSPEIKISLLSKDCLVRLRVIDPKQFLTDTEVRSFSINTVDEKKINYPHVRRVSSLKRMEQLDANAQEEHPQNHLKNLLLRKHLLSLVLQKVI